MARCTAPSRGHRTASGAADCPACGGRSRFSSYGGSSYSPSSYSGGGGGGGSSYSPPRARTKPSWSPAGSSVVYTPSEVSALAPIRRQIESQDDSLDIRDLFLCHAWDDRREFAKTLHDELEKQNVSVWFSEKDIALGTPFMRAIDKGLAKSRIGLVLVTPALLKSLQSEGVADKELSTLLAGDRLIPIVHNTTYDKLREVSPLLGSRNGLSTVEDSLEVVAQKIAELIKL